MTNMMNRMVQGRAQEREIDMLQGGSRAVLISGPTMS
jgi:hypothetical protein